jgi:hypothetical protein
MMAVTRKYLTQLGFEYEAMILWNYNVPFYALPVLSTFVLQRFGICRRIIELQEALSAIRETPMFRTKGSKPIAFEAH